MDLGKVGKVVKAVEIAAPKLDDVAKDAMAWVTQADKRTKAHETYFSRIEDLRNEIADVEDNFNNYGDIGDFDKLRGIYRSDVSKMAKNLEIPKTLKTDISDDLYRLDRDNVNEADFSIHNILNDYHDRIAKLPPNEKKLFDTLVDTHKPDGSTIYPRNRALDYASGLLPRLRKLNPTQQDTFLKMLPDWEQSLDDLETVARLV